MSSYAGRARTRRERLQLVVTLAGDEHLWIAVARHVQAGDAHPPDLHRAPTIRLGVRPGRLARRDPPELLLTVHVVVTVVRQAQIALPGAAPVAEQHGQRAVPGCERDGWRVPPTRRRRPHELALVAYVSAGHEVVAERQRGPGVRSLPRRAERGRPAVAAVDAEQLVGGFEAAVTEPAEDLVATSAEDHEVLVLVTVDVERVGPGDSGQVRDGGGLPSKAERAPHRALVPIERGRLAPTGEEQISTSVVVAIQCRHPTSDEELELPVIPVVDARHRRLFHEPRGDRPRRPTAARDGQYERDRAGGDQRERTEEPPSRALDRRAARRVPNRSGRLVGHDRIEPQRAFRHASRRRRGSPARRRLGPGAWTLAVLECHRSTRPLWGRGCDQPDAHARGKHVSRDPAERP